MCGPVSRYSYGEKLISESVAGARHVAGIEPGIREILVERGGNSTDSIEEAL